LKERRLALEEKRATTKHVAEENKMMMIDLTTMGSFTREWWSTRRLEIISKRRQARVVVMNAVNATLGRENDASATASGGVGGAPRQCPPVGA
jgi:hypothetical protein